jgi:hypothetical protein
MKTFKNIALTTLFSFFIAGYSFASTNSNYSDVTVKECMEAYEAYGKIWVEYEQYCQNTLEQGWGSPGMQNYCYSLSYQIQSMEGIRVQCMAMMENF